MDYAQELLKSLLVMATLIEARDPYTGGHLWRVSQFAQLLAVSAGLPRKDVARVVVGGFLHDLGKIAIPDAILNKPGRLSDDEYAVIRTHPEIGERLLSAHPLAELARDGVLSHHERPDGTGYPHHLHAEVSANARVIAIADAFDAMTSTRPYRRGMARDQGLDILERHLGTQFDETLGRIFVRLGREGALDHIIGHSDMGIPMQDCPECGPTIVVRRDQHSGAFVYCRNCGYKTTVIREAGRIGIAETDDHGTPAELQPVVDFDLIEELVAQASQLLGETAAGR